LILCVSAIRKKISSQKEKTFLLGVFLPIAGEREGKEERETKKARTKKEQYTHQQIVIYLVRVLPGRKKEYCFL